MTLATFAISALMLSAALSANMAGAWVIQQRTGNSGWVDTVWTFGLGFVGIVAALAPLSVNDTGSRQILVAGLVLVWSLRLGLHIASRSAGISDDPRYAELIRGWGPDAPRQMLWLLQMQALVTIPLALSVLLAAHNPTAELGLQDWLGGAVLLAAVMGETIADRQLRQFRSTPGNRGKVCDAGLWRWSRHPNYFFEWLGWCAFPLIAIDLAGLYPLGWISVAAPICMYWLLRHISGVPPLEEHMLRSRGKAYQDYQARTSVFFPAPPRQLQDGARP
jgi:steroid 5-alpha reductase family enzyme